MHEICNVLHDIQVSSIQHIKVSSANFLSYFLVDSRTIYIYIFISTDYIPSFSRVLQFSMPIHMWSTIDLMLVIIQCRKCFYFINFVAHFLILINDMQRFPNIRNKIWMWLINHCRQVGEDKIDFRNWAHTYTHKWSRLLEEEKFFWS